MNKRNLSYRDNPLGAGQFFGATRGQFRGGGFVVSAVTHPDARVVPGHVHANPFFSMLVRGSYREWFRRRHWHVRPLEMVLRPPLTEHQDEIGPGGAQFLCVDVARPFWDGLAQAGIRIERRAFENRPMSGTALRLLRETCERGPGWQAAAEALIAELIAEYSAEDGGSRRREPPWLRRAVELLHEAPLTSSLAGIAAELDLHPVHVSRTFKRHRGMTLSRYLRGLRLHDAARALQRETGWTPGRLRCACEALR